MKRCPFIAVSTLASALVVAVTLSGCGAEATPASSSASPSKPAASSAAAASPAASASAAAKPSASSAAAAPASAKPSGPLTKVRFGLSYTGDQPIFTAIDRGYFAEQGIELDLQRIVSVGDALPLLATNRMDIAAGAFAVGVFNSQLQGVPVKIVASKGIIYPRDSGAAIVVRQDLWDSGKIRDASGLKGAKVAVVNLVSSSPVYVIRALQAKGLTKDDVNFTVLPFDQHLAALQNKAVDAAFLPEPLLSGLIKSGTGTALPGTWIRDVGLGDAPTAIFYSPEFAKTDAAKNFMVGFVRGLRDVAKVVEGNADIAPIQQIASKYTGLKVEDLMLQPLTGTDPDGRVPIDKVKRMQDEWIQYGYQAKAADVDQMVDATFTDYAVKQLGPYK